MKRKAWNPPKERTTRLQEGCRVSLHLWDDKHAWVINRENEFTISVKVDRALDKIELFRWLEKTQPIE